MNEQRPSKKLVLRFEEGRDNNIRDRDEMKRESVLGSLVDEDGWIVARIWSDWGDGEDETARALALQIVDAVNRASEPPAGARYKEGDRIEWTNILRHTFVGTVLGVESEPRYVVQLDDGARLETTESELRPAPTKEPPLANELADVALSMWKDGVELPDETSAAPQYEHGAACPCLHCQQ